MPDDGDTDDALSQRLSDVIPGVFRETRGAMVTKWVLVAEVIDGEDSARALWVEAADGSMAWDTLGLLEFAKAAQLGVDPDTLE